MKMAFYLIYIVAMLGLGAITIGGTFIYGDIWRDSFLGIIISVIAIAPLFNSYRLDKLKVFSEKFMEDYSNIEPTPRYTITELAQAMLSGVQKGIPLDNIFAQLLQAGQPKELIQDAYNLLVKQGSIKVKQKEPELEISKVKEAEHIEPLDQDEYVDQELTEQEVIEEIEKVQPKKKKVGRPRKKKVVKKVIEVLEDDEE